MKRVGVSSLYQLEISQILAVIHCSMFLITSILLVWKRVFFAGSTLINIVPDFGLKFYAAVHY
jgi:hypothetical protein